MPDTGRTISRRTVAAGAAWATPALAVAAAAPVAAASVSTTTTTKPPCTGDIGSTGGTYPVTYDLSGCTPDGTHWDFRLTIAAQQDTADCVGCSNNEVRVTLFDNPKRSRLWIIGQNSIVGGDPATNTNNHNRLYVQKILNFGDIATFPANGDQVRRVAGPGPTYTSFNTGGAGDVAVGNIEVFGGNNDALHVLMNANGSLPCSATGPMAYYKVECRATPQSPWVQLGGIGEINICVPMIQSSVCRYDSAGDDRFRLGISPLVWCGKANSDFKIRRVRRNSNDNSPNTGNDVWTGPLALGPGTTFIDTTTTGNNGGELWIEFTADNGTNVSWIRLDTTTTACPPGPAPVLALASNTCTTVGNPDTRTITVSWTGDATRYRHRDGTSGGGGWSNYVNLNATQIADKEVTFTKTDGNCNTSGQVEICNGTSCATIGYDGVANQSLSSAGEQSVQEQSVESSEARVAETTTTTEAPTTTTTTEAPTTTTGTTAAPETTETPTGG